MLLSGLAVDSSQLKACERGLGSKGLELSALSFGLAVDRSRLQSRRPDFPRGSVGAF